jgi:hypothetical protein
MRTTRIREPGRPPARAIARHECAPVGDPDVGAVLFDQPPHRVAPMTTALRARELEVVEFADRSPKVMAPSRGMPTTCNPDSNAPTCRRSCGPASLRASRLPTPRTIRAAPSRGRAERRRARAPRRRSRRRTSRRRSSVRCSCSQSPVGFAYSGAGHLTLTPLGKRYFVPLSNP